jgi:hypothetical protein
MGGTSIGKWCACMRQGRGVTEPALTPRLPSRNRSHGHGSELALGLPSPAPSVVDQRAGALCRPPPQAINCRWA